MYKLTGATPLHIHTCCKEASQWPHLQGVVSVCWLPQGVLCDNHGGILVLFPVLIQDERPQLLHALPVDNVATLDGIAEGFGVVKVEAQDHLPAGGARTRVLLAWNVVDHTRKDHLGLIPARQATLQEARAVVNDNGLLGHATAEEELKEAWRMGLPVEGHEGISMNLLLDSQPLSHFPFHISAWSTGPDTLSPSQTPAPTSSTSTPPPPTPAPPTASGTQASPRAQAGWEDSLTAFQEAGPQGVAGSRWLPADRALTQGPLRAEPPARPQQQQ